MPVIGLAKEFEEVYRPGRPLPLQLPDDSGALQLLQRIRDEAHRFANGYHQLLMKKRVAESVLDECPGVSENRKQALLKQFGSLDRICKSIASRNSASGWDQRQARRSHLINFCSGSGESNGDRRIGVSAKSVSTP